MNDEFKILQLGHPTLRTAAEPVIDTQDSAFQTLLDKLLQFVLTKGGMGIAAPQIGISQRVFILCSHPNTRYPYAPELPPFIVINPEIIEYSNKLEKDWEGCLSLPGIRALVPRHDKIKVRYLTRDNEQVEKNFSGFLARIFQHEYDHLNGKVFIERTESTQDMMMEQEWQNHIANKERD